MITTSALGLVLAAAGDGPEPSPSPTEPAMTIYTVTPGISGFIAFFVLALVGVLLFRSLVRHMRTVDRAAARREAAESGADRTDGADGTKPAADGSGTAGGGAQAGDSADEPAR